MSSWKDWIPGFSLITSLISNKSQQEIIDINRQNLIVSSRSLIASNLNKYSEELNSLIEKTRPKIKVISDEASIAYIDVLNKVHFFDKERSSSKMLNHIADDIVIMWYNNYHDRLNRSCSISLFEEMTQILHVKPEENEENNVMQFCSSIFEKFSYSKKTEGKSLESAYSNPERFNSLLGAYFDRVSDYHELYNESLKIAMPVFDKVLCLNNEFNDNCQTIEGLIKKNAIEIIKLKESPALYELLLKYESGMTFLRDFYLFVDNIQDKEEHLKLNQTLEILFCLFVLRYRSWNSL